MFVIRGVLACTASCIAGEIDINKSVCGWLFSECCPVVRISFVSVSEYVVRVEFCLMGLREVGAESCYDGVGYGVLKGPCPRFCGWGVKGGVF